MGLAYLTGTDVELDPAQAIQWLTRSAAQGSPLGQCNLGVAYMGRKLAIYSLDEAYKWLRLADMQKYPNVSNYLQQVTEKLSPTQIEAAERQVSLFVAKPFEPPLTLVPNEAKKTNEQNQ